MSDWIEVVGWEKFQHYKSRRPLWIKTYTELLTKREYRALTGAEAWASSQPVDDLRVSGGESHLI